MSLDLDLELRLAVFDHVQRLSEASGGPVSARALNEGIILHGERVPIWSQQKGIFRPKILRDPGAALTIQTSFESPYDDRQDPLDDSLVLIDTVVPIPAILTMWHLDEPWSLRDRSSTW